MADPDRVDPAGRPATAATPGIETEPLAGPENPALRARHRRPRPTLPAGSAGAFGFILVVAIVVVIGFAQRGAAPAVGPLGPARIAAIDSSGALVVVDAS